MKIKSKTCCIHFSWIFYSISVDFLCIIVFLMIKKFPFKLIDLTHTLDSNLPSWDGDCGFNHTIKLDYQDCKSDVKFRVQQVTMQAGIGNHIDSISNCI